MATIHFALESATPASTLRDALTDFSERRPERWPNLDRRFYEVHSVRETQAEVTEGSSFLGGVWERDRYDWSQPHTVTITVLDSNAFARGSFWEYHIEPTVQGGSHITLTVRRSGKNAKGRFLDALLRVFGERIFRQDLERAVAQLAQTTQPATAPHAISG